MTQFKTTLIATAAALGLLATPAIAQVDVGDGVSMSTVKDTMTTAAKREAMKNMTTKQKAMLLVKAPADERLELMKDMTMAEQDSIKAIMMDPKNEMMDMTRAKVGSEVGMDMKTPTMKAPKVDVPTMDAPTVSLPAVVPGAMDGTMDTGTMDPRDMTGVVQSEGSVSMDTDVMMDTTMTQPSMPAEMGTTVSSGTAIMSGTVDTGTLGSSTMTTTTTSFPMQTSVVTMQPSVDVNDTTRMMSAGDRLATERSILQGMSKAERMDYVKMAPESRKAMMDAAVMSRFNAGSMSTGVMGSMETSQSMGGMTSSTSTMIEADNPMGITCPEGTVPQSDGTCMMR